MKNSILSLEGVEVLSKKQMKNVGGGLGHLTNATCTGNTMQAGDTTVWECKYQYQRTFIGMDWGAPQDLDESNAYGPCPANKIC
jgi:hypothetical protein